ncbi:3-oxoacid CoA-transferase subunit B [Oleispirillum naphthae]|uniref:3-oxoacid CoA-transferase subunit B n=1 Tax=Oleispirillum naphthae TaxID=2838853 RepID=UPI003082622D
MNSKELIARRIAKEFVSGNVVNLGAGVPQLVANYLAKDVFVWLHAENGIVGMGKASPDLPPDRYRTDAGEMPVSIIPGGAVIDSATSFGIIRGGHLDATVLGTMQVDAEGSIANWMVPGGKFAGPGGAMDLVSGAKRVIVATEHCSKDGKPKIVEKCTFPLTGYGVVDSIFSELAFIKITKDGLVLMETAPGVTAAEVIAKTGAPLAVGSDLREMEI